MILKVGQRREDTLSLKCPVTGNLPSFYNYVGMTREGKRVNFKLPKIWNLKGVCTVGDSICKVSGDSTIRVIKRTGTVFVKMNEK